MTLPRMYGDFAPWWPLLSPPEDYVEEAGHFRSVLVGSGVAPLQTLLELGSGGGNNASHLKAWFQMTLVDVSPGMLVVSHALNPECIHVEGDMRTVRLGRHFDAVFVHDAIGYMTTEEDLLRALRSAFVHCRPGGVAIIAPDFLAETFAPATDHGGHDGELRSLRFMEWCWDPDPSDNTCIVDYIYALREGNGPVQVETDRHLEGLFPLATWMRLLEEVGFQAEHRTYRHSQVERELDFFVARRPEHGGDRGP